MAMILLRCFVLLATPSLGAQTAYVEDSAGAGLTAVHAPAAGHSMVAMAGGGSVGDFDNDG